MKLRDLLVFDPVGGATLDGGAPSWPDLDNTLMETQLLDVALSPLTYTMGALLEVRTSLFFQWDDDTDYNVAALLFRQVERLEWSSRDLRKFDLRAVVVLGWEISPNGDGRFSAQFGCMNEMLQVGFVSAELFAGVCPGLPQEVIPDYGENTPASVRGKVASWDMELESYSRYLFDPESMEFRLHSTFGGLWCDRERAEVNVPACSGAAIDVEVDDD